MKKKASAVPAGTAGGRLHGMQYKPYQPVPRSCPRHRIGTPETALGIRYRKDNTPTPTPNRYADPGTSSQRGTVHAGNFRTGGHLETAACLPRRWMKSPLCCTAICPMRRQATT